MLFTTSPAKTADGLRLGADEVVVSTNEDEMKKHAQQLRLHPRCRLGQHDINAYLSCSSSTAL